VHTKGVTPSLVEMKNTWFSLLTEVLLFPYTNVQYPTLKGERVCLLDESQEGGPGIEVGP